MNDSHYVVPIKTCRTQEGSSAVMVEAAARLYIAGDVGGQWLAFRSNPVNNCTLHPLGVISPSTIRTLLDLLVHNKSVLNVYGSFCEKTRQIGYHDHLFLWGSHESNLETRYRSKELSENRLFLLLAATQVIRNLKKKVVPNNIHSCQALIFLGIVTHGLKAIHDERLHVAEHMDSPA